MGLVGTQDKPGGFMETTTKRIGKRGLTGLLPLRRRDWDLVKGEQGLQSTTWIWTKVDILGIGVGHCFFFLFLNPFRGSLV